MSTSNVAITTDVVVLPYILFSHAPYALSSASSATSFSLTTLQSLRTSLSDHRFRPLVLPLIWFNNMLYLALLFHAVTAVRAWSEDSLLKYVDHLDLVSDFIPNIPEHWVGHHTRTPFAVSSFCYNVLLQSIDWPR
jgi:hypothetical protein